MSDALVPGQPAESAPYKATDAIGYGWQKFKERPSTLLVPMIVVLVVLIAVGLLFQFVIVGGFFGTKSCRHVEHQRPGQPVLRPVLLAAAPRRRAGCRR